MKHFDQLEELQKTKEAKELVEIYLNGAPTYKVAYILHLTPEYLTFAEVGSNTLLTGVTICSTDDIASISTNTIYLDEFTKQISHEPIYQQALNDIAGISEFTFDGFLSQLVKSQTVTELTTENEEIIAGRVAGYTDDIVIFDEYSVENTRRIARTYFNRDLILRISVDVPWLRTIARFLAENNL